ncbi:MAG: ABC transporter permease [Ignavibacteriae bacterium HGW-Ignavibacteriae-2]|nr:MAG: ABC transporter permease [Ignavibacteriae bacterium HGW-Ignavibacteriae-2]
MKEKSISNFRKKAKRTDKIAKGIISLGGFGVILSISAILLFLFYESFPLSFSASITEYLGWNASTKKVLLAGIDRYNEIEYLLDENGKVEFYRIKDQKIFQTDSIILAENEKIISADKGSLNDEIFAVGTNTGRIITAQIKMTPFYSRDERVIKASFAVKAIYSTTDSSTLPEPIYKIQYSKNEEASEYWAWLNNRNELRLRIYDADEEKFYNYNITDQLGNSKTSNFTISTQGDHLIAGTEGGELFWFDLSDIEDVQLKSNWRSSKNTITSLAFLIGDNSLVVGDAKGFLQLWFPVRSSNNEFRFKKIHDFRKHKNEITDIIVSPRNRTFLSIDSAGELHLNYSTTSNTEIEFKPFEYAIKTAAFSPKSDALILLDSKNRVGQFIVDNEHPEVSFETLFGKAWYEGYETPEFVWQSTGGSDEFEPKFSLIPLIFGTLKGTLYAMLFSIPLAILAAIYVSQFAPKKFARIIKPTIEIMAALPSVVIGFLAGLYFSPLFEKHLVTIFIAFIALPLFFLLSVFCWRLIPEAKRRRLPSGADMLFVIPFLIFSFLVAVLLANTVELFFFSGNISQWLYDTLNIHYDQRNSFVVGFALGFAVIPIIFTISEDALSNVPYSLTSASLALGASPWQTVKKIILPAAAGGIFSAVMLGLGRAIGETMIVLMATGNTPIMNLSPFNGFRAMSANIAVEIPEAPVDGTLYRVLFLTAFLLFVFTFLINGVAALIGDRLRKKYARF